MRLPTVMIAAFLAFSGCLSQPAGEGVTCNPPYMRLGDGCCLDQDGNGVCDRDEATTTLPPTTLATSTTTTSTPTTSTIMLATTLSTSTTSTSTTSTTSTTSAPTTTQPITCTDTDGGENLYVKGTASRGGVESGTDKCMGSAILWEYYCAGNAIGMRQVQCPLGCEDGRCHGCVDTDGGDNPSVYGEVTLGDTLKKQDICSNRDEKVLREFYCVSAEEVGSREVVCPGVCSGGACA